MNATTPWVPAIFLTLGVLGSACLTSTPASDGPAPRATTCTDTCASLGHQCGTVCGQPCGSCETDAEGHTQSCLGGHCRCVPACSADQCGQDDGCGQRCPCAGDLTCRDCAIRLVRVDQRSQGGAVERVTLALEGSNLAGGVLPRMADFTLRSNPPMDLVAVRRDAALVDARKELVRFVETDREFQRVGDGVWRLVLLTGARNTDIQPGRWMTLTLERPAGATAVGPVAFTLERRTDVLAPQAADTLLQVSTYDAPLTVTP
jgi:hypothetical protein